MAKATTKAAPKKAASKKATKKTDLDKGVNSVPTRLQTDSEKNAEKKKAESNKPKTEKVFNAQASGVEIEKDVVEANEKVWNDLDIPEHRKGENLHEQNPELAVDANRLRASRLESASNQSDLKKTKTGEE